MFYDLYVEHFEPEQTAVNEHKDHWKPVRSSDVSCESWFLLTATVRWSLAVKRRLRQKLAERWSPEGDDEERLGAEQHEEVSQSTVQKKDGKLKLRKDPAAHVGGN